MARPTWVTVVGVLGIVFGCTGILGGGQEMMMPKYLLFQQQILAGISGGTERGQEQSDCHDDGGANSRGTGRASDTSGGSPESSAHRGAAAPAAPGPCQVTPSPEGGFFAVFKNTWDLPPWFSTWLVVSGAARCLVGAFYLFAAIWLLQLKPSSIRLLSLALALGIVLGLVQVIVILVAGAFMAGSAVGMVLDAVLLAVIWMSDRSAFRRPEATSENQPATP